MLQERLQTPNAGQDVRPNPFRAVSKFLKRLVRPAKLEAAVLPATSNQAYNLDTTSRTAVPSQQYDESGYERVDRQAPNSLPNVPPTTGQRNPFRNVEFMQGLAPMAPSHTTNPFVIATSNAAEVLPTQANAPTAPTGRQYDASNNGGVHHQEYGPIVNIERVGIAITGINYGHVTQIDEFNVLRNLPIHPDISGHLSDYFPESRADDERRILQWIDCRHPPELVLCVLGKVGVGKSTLAKHLAMRLGNDKRLAANIFFGFALPHWSVESVVRMAAGQLCGAFPALTRAVCEAIRLDVDPSISVETRIQTLILEPIRSLHLPYPLVILIDALDQWSHHPLLIKALSCLAAETHLIKFLVFGRPGFEDRFQDVSMRSHHLPDVVEDVMGKYFKERFNRVRWEYGRKPSDQTIDQLVNKASGLFIWSSTVCSLLEDELSCPSPHKAVAAILQSQQSVGDHDMLATLYHGAISLRFPKPDHRAKLKVLLGALLVLQEPLYTTAFASLVSMTAPNIRKIMADLRPLQIGQNDPDMVYPASMRFHLSFLEYLQSTDTPSHLAFPTDTFTSHSQLGEACLEELRRLLSSPPSTFITPLQMYATRYWPTHIAHGTPTVTPTSNAEWKATPHSAIFDSLSIAQWQRWATSYLQLFHPGTTLDLTEHTQEVPGTPTHDTPRDLISRLAQSLLESPATGGLSEPVAVAEVAVRLQHRASDAWLVLGEAYRDAAQTITSGSLLNSAVQACRYAAEIGGDGGHKIPEMLAFCLHERFLRFGGSEDLIEAIVLRKELLLLAPPGHPDRAAALNHLASSLEYHSHLTGISENLEEAMVLYREALSLVPSGHPRRAAFLNNLAISLQSRLATGAAEILDKAIVLLREAVWLLPSGHPHQASSLNSLASALRSHFDRTGAAESLNEAIILEQHALFLTPSGHPSRAPFLSVLAHALQSHFGLTGTIKSLDGAIVLNREALSLRPPGHPDRANSLNNLATSLQSLFELTGAAENLAESIELHRETLQLWPSGHPERASTVNNLASALHSHFKRTGAARSLDEAISLHQEALSLWPTGPPPRDTSLNNLAHCFLSRFKATGGPKYLEEAIALFQEVLPLQPPGHPHRPFTLGSLAVSLQHHFDHTGTTASLDEAITLHREALSSPPPGHHHRLISLRNLPSALKASFRLTGSIEARDEAESLLREAAEIAP